jgi:hypothetical protein
MMDFASTQSRAKEVAPTTSCEEGHTKADVARTPKGSHPPTADEVDKMYCQLVEMHALTVAQLAECARWRWSNLTSNADHADTDR